MKLWLNNIHDDMEVNLQVVKVLTGGNGRRWRT